jgi:hypothetical protein
MWNVWTMLCQSTSLLRLMNVPHLQYSSALLHGSYWCRSSNTSRMNVIQQTCLRNVRHPWGIYSTWGELRYLMMTKRPVKVYLHRAFSKCESYKKQSRRASAASKAGPKDMNLETRPNGAKFVHSGTPCPIQIFDGIVKQIRSKPVANDVSDCVLLSHIKCTVYKLFLSMALQPLLGQHLLITHASRSHSDTPHWVLLCSGDQLDAETIYTHTHCS